MLRARQLLSDHLTSTPRWLLGAWPPSAGSPDRPPPASTIDRVARALCGVPARETASHQLSMVRVPLKVRRVPGGFPIPRSTAARLQSVPPARARAHRAAADRALSATSRSQPCPAGGSVPRSVAAGAGVGLGADAGPGEMTSGGIGPTTVCPAGASLHCARTIESTNRSGTSPTVTAIAASRKLCDHCIGSPDGTGAVRRITCQPGAPATGMPSDGRRRGLTDPAGPLLASRGPPVVRSDAAPDIVAPPVKGWRDSRTRAKRGTR